MPPTWVLRPPLAWSTPADPLWFHVPPQWRARARVAGCLGLSLLLHLLLLGADLDWSAGPSPHPPSLPDKFVKLTSPARRPLGRHVRAKPVARPLARQQVARTAAAGAPRPGLLSAAAGGGTAPVPQISAAVTQLQAVTFVMAAPTPGLAVGAGPGGVATARTSASAVDLGSDLMGVEGLGAGRHRAVVVVDPKDRQNLRGVLYLSNVYSESIERAELDNPRPLWVDSGQSSGTRLRQDVERKALEGLAAQLSERSGVRAEVMDGLPLDDPRLKMVPFVLLTANGPFEVTDSEALGLAAYLQAGGFVYAEVSSRARVVAGGHEWDQPSLRKLFRDGFGLSGLREGRDWRFAPLHPSSPVYHCYYDIAGVPRGYWDHRFWYWQDRAAPLDYLEGIWLGDELVGIYSQKAYADMWAGEVERLREVDASNNFAGMFSIGGEEIPVYRLGVNILVYALTRDGSLAQRMVAE